MPEELGATPEQRLIHKVMERHRIAEEAEDPQRRKSLDDLRFCDPTNQWESADRVKREQEGKPCLSIDRTTPFVKQITNEQRQIGQRYMFPQLVRKPLRKWPKSCQG